VEEKLTQIVSAIGPVPSIILAALLVILGIVIVVYPVLLAWLVGIALVLTGIGLFAIRSSIR
jgi:hypothetical protein